MSTVVALAGRLIDRVGEESPHFPLENVLYVREQIRGLFLRLDVRMLVCSAAGGADLIALGEADSLGIVYRVVLPFARELFRELSVVCRPGDWAEDYDRILDRAAARGDVVTLAPNGSEPDAFGAANLRILDEAERMGAQLGTRVAAVVVSDERRSDADCTWQLADQAQQRGMEVFELATIRVKRA